MQTFYSFCLLLIGVNALPQKLESTLTEAINRNDERLITGPIVQAIEDLRQSIKDAGLDPYNIERESFKSALPVPVLFSVEAIIEDFCVKGLSDIIIHNINYSILFNRLTFDIRLPGIYISIGKASKDVTVFGSNLKSSVSGSVSIIDIKLTGNIRFRIGLWNISISSIEINSHPGVMDSKLKGEVNGQDVSRPMNNFVEKTIPENLEKMSKDIDELLTIYVKKLIEANL